MLWNNYSEGNGGKNGKAKVGFYHHLIEVIESWVAAGIDIPGLHQAPCIAPGCPFVYSIVGKRITVVPTDHFCSAATLCAQYNPDQYANGYEDDPLHFNPINQTAHMHLFRSKKKMPACSVLSAKEPYN